PVAVGPLWQSYFHQMVHLARAQLRARRHPGIEADAEDAALSAFQSFCAGAPLGEFPRLTDRDDLWRLLVVITARKARNHVRRGRRRKRGDGRVLGEADLLEGAPARGPTRLDQVAGPQATPEFTALMLEEYQRLLDRLGDETLCRIALWKMEGYT